MAPASDLSSLLLLLLPFAWFSLCAYLRRRRSLLLASLHPITHCHALICHTLSIEFPFLSHLSLEFGIFRTYAIPHISRVLQKNGAFAADASKRYYDTVILARELLHHHVDSDRGSLAVRRLNFLHSQYPIRNSEFLYVLSIFILMPIEWAARYGHREWTESEKSAYYTVWHDIGTRMGIQNIPQSIPAVSKFKEDYEAMNMMYSDANREIADATLVLFLSAVPRLLRPIVCRIGYAFMDDRLREAMGYPMQPFWMRHLSHVLLKLHGLMVSWLPPRPLSWAVLLIPSGCPKFQGVEFDPEALYKLAFQLYRPAPYGKGYRIKELGSIRPGELGKSYEGSLICSWKECSNLSCPQELTPTPKSKA